MSNDLTKCSTNRSVMASPGAVPPRKRGMKRNPKGLSLVMPPSATGSLSPLITPRSSSGSAGIPSALGSASSMRSNSNGPDRRDSLPTERIGKLRLGQQTVALRSVEFSRVRDLGRGSFGTVYLARVKAIDGDNHHDLVGIDVAVKQQPDSSGCQDNCGLCDRCENRTRLVTSITRDIKIVQDARSNRERGSEKGSGSRQIIEYFGVDFREGLVTFYMEPMSMALFDYYMVTDPNKADRKIPRRPVPAILPDNVLSYVAVALLKGLVFLRVELNALHRDVKPHNILLSSTGEIKIGDFGLAKVLDPNQNNTFVGSDSYLPPERLNPDTASCQYGEESDVWAYGLTILEVGLLKFPYQAKTQWESISMIVRSPAPTLPPTLYSPELCSFVATCLLKERDARPGFVVPAPDKREAELSKHPFFVARRHLQGSDLSPQRDWLIKNVVPFASSTPAI